MNTKYAYERGTFYENESCVEGSHFLSLTLRINSGGIKMENRITVREAVTEIEIAAFWEQLYNYYKRDIFPDSVDGEQNHFLGGEYRQHMEIIHKRPQDRCYYLLFYQNEQNVGFAMPVIYTSEDGKCFIMDFCVYPEFRGNGMGKECARALLKWAEKKGHFMQS